MCILTEIFAVIHTIVIKIGIVILTETTKVPDSIHMDTQIFPTINTRKIVTVLPLVIQTSMNFNDKIIKILITITIGVLLICATFVAAKDIPPNSVSQKTNIAGSVQFG